MITLRTYVFIMLVILVKRTFVCSVKVLCRRKGDSIKVLVFVFIYYRSFQVSYIMRDV